jgi:predicted phosphoadenosine phosphosulfate sulfurtransferase
MPRQSVGVDCLSAARVRIALAFDNFTKVCVSYSAGKDSTVLLHLVMQEARKRDRQVAVLLVDLEAQYKATIDHAEALFERYADNIDPYWVALPLHLRNAVSVFEPFWLCWDPSATEAWVRQPPKFAITDPARFPFFQQGMEFEEFVPLFADWYSDGVDTAFFVGIRTQESYNRFLTIASPHKTMWDGHRFTTGVCSNSDSFNFYPLYDWTAEDIWTFHAQHRDLPYNRIYDLMHAAGVPLTVQRICQPYGDDQRRGLWLYHLLEPETWGRVVARVNGANGGALYSREHGNINGYRKVSKPDHLTWKEFAYYLVASMPPVSQEHYANKIGQFTRWWGERGYPEGIPDEIDYDLEIQKLAPSWRRVCKTLLRNDWWCKGLGFTQHKSAAYEQYLELMRRRKAALAAKGNLSTEPSEVAA